MLNIPLEKEAGKKRREKRALLKNNCCGNGSTSFFHQLIEAEARGKTFHNSTFPNVNRMLLLGKEEREIVLLH